MQGQGADMNEVDPACERLMLNLERRLGKHEYICCDRVTICDVVIYTELATVSMLYREQIPRHDYPLLHHWFQKMSQDLPVLEKMNSQFKQVIEDKEILSGTFSKGSGLFAKANLF